MFHCREVIKGHYEMSCLKCNLKAKLTLFTVSGNFDLEQYYTGYELFKEYKYIHVCEVSDNDYKMRELLK